MQEFARIEKTSTIKNVQYEDFVELAQSKIVESDYYKSTNIETTSSKAVPRTFSATNRPANGQIHTLLHLRIRLALLFMDYFERLYFYGPKPTETSSPHDRSTLQLHDVCFQEATHCDTQIGRRFPKSLTQQQPNIFKSWCPYVRQPFRICYRSRLQIYGVFQKTTK